MAADDDCWRVGDVVILEWRSSTRSAKKEKYVGSTAVVLTEPNRGGWCQVRLIAEGQTKKWISTWGRKIRTAATPHAPAQRTRGEALGGSGAPSRSTTSETVSNTPNSDTITSQSQTRSRAGNRTDAYRPSAGNEYKDDTVYSGASGHAMRSNAPPEVMYSMPTVKSSYASNVPSTPPAYASYHAGQYRGTTNPMPTSSTMSPNAVSRTADPAPYNISSRVPSSYTMALSPATNSSNYTTPTSSFAASPAAAQSTYSVPHVAPAIPTAPYVGRVVYSQYAVSPMPPPTQHVRSSYSNTPSNASIAMHAPREAFPSGTTGYPSVQSQYSVGGSMGSSFVSNTPSRGAYESTYTTPSTLPPRGIESIRHSEVHDRGRSSNMSKPSATNTPSGRAATTTVTIATTDNRAYVHTSTTPPYSKGTTTEDPRRSYSELSHNAAPPPPRPPVVSAIHSTGIYAAAERAVTETVPPKPPQALVETKPLSAPASCVYSSSPHNASTSLQTPPTTPQSRDDPPMPSNATSGRQSPHPTVLSLSVPTSYPMGHTPVVSAPMVASLNDPPGSALAPTEPNPPAARTTVAMATAALLAHAASSSATPSTLSEPSSVDTRCNDSALPPNADKIGQEPRQQIPAASEEAVVHNTSNRGEHAAAISAVATAVKPPEVCTSAVPPSNRDIPAVAMATAAIPPPPRCDSSESPSSHRTLDATATAENELQIWPLPFPVRFALRAVERRLQRSNGDTRGLLQIVHGLWNNLHSKIKTQHPPDSKLYFAERFAAALCQCVDFGEFEQQCGISTQTVVFNAQRFEHLVTHLQSCNVPESERSGLDDNTIDKLRKRLVAYQYQFAVVVHGGRVLVEPASVKKRPSCRAMRHFWRYRDHFATLKISKGDYKNSAVLDVVRSVLTRGITVDRRTFVYLFDKKDKVWLFAPEKDGPREMHSPENFLQWIGDLSKQKHLGKVADRVALAFSKSLAVLEINDEQIQSIDDVVYRNKNFTDGIGYFGDAFGERLRLALETAGVPCRTVPSAAQIRIDGIKGVITRNPGAKPSDAIFVRPSMTKFQSHHKVLEIVRLESQCRVVEIAAMAAAAPENTDQLSAKLPLVAPPSTLNRDILLLLGARGIAAEAVLTIQTKAIEEILATSRDREAALRFVSRCHDDVLADALHRALIAGVPLDEPFVAWQLQQLQRKRLEKIKYKAHIPVDQSALLMGVVDESGSLEANEVCVLLSSEHIVLGRVAVTAFPCLTPGDVRVVNAVAPPPSLAHLARVIVFPIKGERPLPDMMSNHDLDGDFYWVTWDPQLVPRDNVPSIEYYQDADLPPSVPVQSEGALLNAMAEQFCTFLENELGLIATARMCAIDKGLPEGDIKDLAIRQAKALDARKLGKPEKLPSNYAGMPKPHWLGMQGNTYVSRSLVGLAYDQIATSLFDQMQRSVIGPDPAFSTTEWQKYTTVAQHAYRAFVASDLAHKAAKKDTAEFFAAFRHMYLSDTTTVEEARNKVGELYNVAYSQAHQNPQYAKYLFIPWLFADLLIRNWYEENAGHGAFDFMVAADLMRVGGIREIS